MKIDYLRDGRDGRYHCCDCQTTRLDRRIPSAAQLRFWMRWDLAISLTLFQTVEGALFQNIISSVYMSIQIWTGYLKFQLFSGSRVQNCSTFFTSKLTRRIEDSSTLDNYLLQKPGRAQGGWSIVRHNHRRFNSITRTDRSWCVWMAQYIKKPMNNNEALEDHSLPAAKQRAHNLQYFRSPMLRSIPLHTEKRDRATYESRTKSSKWREDNLASSNELLMESRFQNTRVSCAISVPG